jgi:hypothetical protein
MRRHSRSEQDQQDAEQFARLMCVHPDAVDDFITYARHEVRALLNEHASVVKALANALLERLTLTGAEIDAVIVNTLMLKDLAAEKSCRLDWVQRMLNAATFAAYKEADESPP